MGEKHPEVHVLEDSLLRTEFIIKGGYLKEIRLEVKSREDIGQIHVGDKVQLSRWLSSVNMALLAHISNPPTDTINVGVESPEETYGEMKCNQCNGELVKKKPCCGGTGEILRCKLCGATYRVIKGRKDRMKKIPPPSPLTSEVPE